MDQFALQYGKLRASVLSRHFALNKRFRSNFFFQTNSLQGLPATEADRWRIVNHGGDNPLMTSGQLMTCLAVEHHLGSPDAARILRVLLQTIGSLYKFSGNHFDGYILRWDPVIYEGEWRDDSRSRYSKAFYINDDGTYNYSTPLQDPRSRRLFSEAEWNVATPEERNNRGDDYWQWLSRYRRWEVSMDELVGLVMGYDTVHRLVAVDDIRAEVSTQANKLGDYLAEHGYYLVRPSGGFNARGGSGILPALEYPFSRVFARITGEPYYIRNGFQAVMEKADVWKALEGPLNAWSVTGLAVGALLTYLFGFINAVIVSLGLEALFGTTTPFTPAQLGQIWAIYSHRDVFDVWSATNADRYDRNAAGEFALAYALSLLSLRRRFDDYMNGAQGGETEKWATQFPPFLGLTGLDDSEPNVRDAYLNWLRGRRNRGDLSDDDMSRSAFASAVAVVLAQGAEEDARLVQLLKQSLSWNDVPVVDSEESGGKALEYLCALSLAWLHRKRMQDRGESIATADFPELPGLADLQSWPAASVPASVLNEARAGAVAVPLDVIQRSNPPVLRPDGSADLFLDDPVVPRSAVPAPVLPDPEQEFLQYRDVTVPENAAAVPTGIRLRPGDDFELDAGGRIWAGVPFTGENGPNGWDRIEYDRKFFLTGQPNGHPFCLLGQLGRDGAYFFIGEHRDRQRYRGEETYELFLRVNDDAPGNGSGAFQCRVKTWGQPLTISHRMIDFGDAAVCGSNEQELIIENWGTQPVTIRSISTPEAPFSVGPYSPDTVLQLGEQFTVPIIYSPVAPVRNSGAITVYSDSRLMPDMQVALTGQGVQVPPTIAFVPRSISFGTIILGDQLTKWLTVRNLGSSNLVVRADPLDDGTFRVTSPLPEVISCFQRAALGVTCKPQAAGSYQALFTATTNDPWQPNVRIGISAQCLEDDFGPDPCAALDAELATLQEDLQDAVGSQKAAITRQIQAVIAEKRRRGCS